MANQPPEDLLPPSLRPKEGDVVSLNSEVATFLHEDASALWVVIDPSKQGITTPLEDSRFLIGSSRDGCPDDQDVSKILSVEESDIVRKTLPNVGDEVFGDSSRSDLMDQTWRMLGVFEYQMGDSMKRVILIGCIPENLGGIDRLVERLKQPNEIASIKTPQDYVQIKRYIRQAGGAYRDFTSDGEFHTSQKKAEANASDEVERLRKAMESIQKKLGRS